MTSFQIKAQSKRQIRVAFVQYNTPQHNTTRHNTTQHNTTQHNTTQHNAMQCNAMQYNTIQCSLIVVFVALFPKDFFYAGYKLLGI